jgi:hypothetical protein
MINVLLDSVVTAAEQFAEELNGSELTEFELRRLIIKKCNSITYLTGVTVAYQPFEFSSSQELLAPFYQKDSAKFIDLEKIYDYTNDSLSTSGWYTKVVAQGKPIWSEPYYGEGAQMVVTDYGVPFYKTADKKTIKGIVSFTIQLSELSKFIYSTELGTTGYGLLISRDGNYLAHPTKSYILKKNFFSAANERGLDKEAQYIISQSSGSLSTNKIDQGRLVTLFFKEIPASSWKIISIFRTNDLVKNQHLKKRKRIHLWMASSFLVFVLLVGLFRINGLSYQELWYLAVISSAIMIPNIVNIWYLNLNENYIGVTQGEIEIQNRSVLDNFIIKQGDLLSQLSGQQYKVIPTGIHIDEMEFVDSYNVNVGGKIWQKFSDSLNIDLKPGYYMPQISPFAEADFKEIVSDEQLPGYRLVTWEFRSTLRMNFNYSRYPFDLPEVNIELIHPEFHKNVILIPDLDSYEILNPRMKPGLSANMVLPTSELILSHFSFMIQDYQTNFGINNYSGLDEVQILQFNVLFKRRFINAFVANIIPILIVALLLYLIIYSSTKGNITMTGISSLGGIETSAAFFFVLVLAHIDLRKTVSTPDITYIDLFYFIMYFMLGFSAFNIVIFTKSTRKNIFDYRDNFWVKLLYWPVLLFLFLFVTIMQFYN